VLDCWGDRAQESSERAKMPTFQLQQASTNTKRDWYRWLPIHQMTTKEVFASIAKAGQKPHWAYSKGMTRLSCIFCIMASKKDLQTASKLMPDVYEKYLAMERKLSHTLIMPGKAGPKYLNELVTESNQLTIEQI
jgi:3'-phosphoadenosine 5'-phosphosulfate sulfotransferase (PAPS reductase)/FAD synthetase